jgi:hypothetical protein
VVAFVLYKVIFAVEKTVKPLSPKLKVETNKETNTNEVIPDTTSRTTTENKTCLPFQETTSNTATYNNTN